MSSEVKYQTGFGNEFATEAVAGGLPNGNSGPQVFQTPAPMYCSRQKPFVGVKASPIFGEAGSDPTNPNDIALPYPMHVTW